MREGEGGMRDERPEAATPARYGEGERRGG